MSAGAPRRGEAGFTLLEVLVALSVLGFLMLGLAQGLRFGLLAWDRQAQVIAARSDTSPADVDDGIAESLRFGTTLVAAHGMVVPGYDEAPVAAHLAGSEVEIGVDIGIGDGRAEVWTCDLTHGYISINADYRS